MTRSLPDVGAPRLPELEALAGLIDSTTVSGIPTLVAPSSRGQLITAGLLFRVGWADETLATRGITHLVEHLALFGLGQVDAHHNGATDELFTLFHVTGTESEVVDYLNGVCAGLTDLPVERMDVEKEILRTEASRRDTRWAAPHLERYGATGPGLGSFDEFGLDALTADDLRAWARTRFTRDNAALWIAGDGIPDGLELALPAGERSPVPEWRELDQPKPAWFERGQDVVLLHAVVEDRSVASVFAGVASKALFRTLRQEGGLSYSAQCEWQPIGAGRGRVVVFADARPETREAVAVGVVGVLEALAAGQVDEHDLDAVKTAARQQSEMPDLGAAMLPTVASWLLEGVPIRARDEVNRDVEALTGADLARVARAVLDDAVVQVPAGVTALNGRGFVQTPIQSAAAVGGRRHPHVSVPDDVLIIGEEGVSRQLGDRVATVRFDECVAMLTVPDGARQLYGSDGFMLVIEPNLFRGVTPDVIVGVDAMVPAEVHIALPPRELDQIPPKPGPTPHPVRDAMVNFAVAVGISVLGLMLLSAAGALSGTAGRGIMSVAIGAPLGVLAYNLRPIVADRWRRRRG